MVRVRIPNKVAILGTVCPASLDKVEESGAWNDAYNHFSFSDTTRYNYNFEKP